MKPSVLLYFNEGADQDKFRIKEIEKIFEEYNIEKQTSFDAKLDNQKPSIIIITTAILKGLEHLIGQLLYLHQYLSSNLMIVYENIQEIKPLLNLGVANFIDVGEIESELEFYVLTSKKNFEREINYTQMVSSFLKPEAVFSYLIYAVKEGFAFKFKEDIVLPGYQHYSQKIIDDAILSAMQSFHGEQSYTKGVKLITDQDNFYAVLLLIFTKENPEAVDPRLKRETLYAVALYLPQFLAVQLPRDDLLLEYTELAYESTIPPVNRENLMTIKEIVLEKLLHFYFKVKISY
ncbi:MAG: hypothetical protein GPJ54_19975 [Candidatus Heimdallarchaeota archaeon]|nr:hypothetical protein [Candidatus Heimdallarchaeota archaeon]